MYEIETLRLRLRPITEQYLDDLAQMWRDPVVMRYLPTGKPVELEVTKRELDFMVQHWKTHNFGIWRIAIKDRDPFAGYCGLQHVHQLTGVRPESIAGEPDVEIFYGVARNLWSKGIAFEAAKAAIRFGFETLTLPRIVAALHPENLASRRILEKLGMKEDPGIRYYENVPHYVIYREDFTPDNAIYSVHPI